MRNTMSLVFCRGCGGKIHETAPACPHCGALQVLEKSHRATSNLFRDAIGWLVIVGFVAFLLAMPALMRNLPIPKAIVEWAEVLFGTAFLCLIWMFVSTNKRRRFLINGLVDLPLLWVELRSTFGIVIMWMFILAAGVIGGLVGRSLF
jgi:uncharacterized membrane protein YvbJ